MLTAARGQYLLDREILRRLTLPDDNPDRLVITPIVDLEAQLHSDTFDLRLGTEFIVFESTSKTHVDPVALPTDTNVFTRSQDEVRFIKRLSPAEEFVLHAGELALASTLEYIRLPKNVGGDLDGRSTWARIGLNVHSTAGAVHPGSHGVITFELFNVGKLPIKLYPGMRVAQIRLYTLLDKPIRSYQDIPGSKHVGHIKASRSAYWKDKEFEIIRKRISGKRLDLSTLDATISRLSQLRSKLGEQPIDAANEDIGSLREELGIALEELTVLAEKKHWRV